VLTDDQPERYDRQVLLPPIPTKGQEKIKQALVLIAGAGELLKNRLLIYEGLSMSLTGLGALRDPHCEQCGEHKGD